MRKISLFLVVLLPVLAYGKLYYYPEIKTDIYFYTDGSSQVLQQRTYSFDGDFSWADVNLKKTGADDIVINQVAEKINDVWQPLDAEIQDNPNSVYVRWNYSAHNEEKTFLLDYTIRGAVKRYQDVAEFYWKFIEDEHEKISVTKLELYLPQTSADLFKVYIHSRARPGTLTFSETFDHAVIEQRNISENTFVEVRMLASPSIFSDMRLQNENRYENILREEKRNFLMSSLKKFVLFPIGLVLMIALPIILLLVFYFKYGREPKLPYLGMYEHEPPRKVPPVLVSAILYQKPDKTTIFQSLFRGMFASMLDLTTKGLVSIQELKENGKTHYQFNLDKPEKIKELDPFSQEVAQFFFNEQTSVTDEELKKYAERHRLEFQRLLSDIYNRAVEWWKNTLGGSLLDLKSSKFYNIFILSIIPSIILGALLVGNGLSALVGGPTPPFFAIPISAGVIIFIILVFVGKSILRWSPAAFTEQKRWHNFRKFLAEGSAIEQAPITLLPIWEHYFVYAVVLGVAQKFLKNLTTFSSKHEQPLILPAWYVAASGTRPASIASFAESMSNFESFTSNFTSMMNSFSTSASTGGGFSGGGGGGGGGGSSGAG